MLPVAIFGYHNHGYRRTGCTMYRDGGGGGNQSEITKYLNKIVEHSNTLGDFHSVNYK